MKGSEIKLLCIGKLKTAYWIEAFAHYCKMLGKWRKLSVMELRDSSGDLTIEKRKIIEGEKILENMPSGYMKIALWEKGSLLSSSDFARQLVKWEVSEMKKVCFIIGGPFGLSQEVIKASDFRLSLSLMTWPHEMARVLLAEQLYRAYSIIEKLPYHH